eukprot:g3068.t1
MVGKVDEEKEEEVGQSKRRDRGAGVVEIEMLEKKNRPVDLPGTLWHRRRRRAIRKEFPKQISALEVGNPWTLLIGVAVVAVHAACAIWVSRTESYGIALAAASTVGSFCKFYMFMVAHEIAHCTVGDFARQSETLRQLLLHFLTLPGLTSSDYEYYSHWHVAHHRLLGKQHFGDLENIFSLTEFDGDLLAPTTWAMLLMEQLETIFRRAPKDGPPRPSAPLLLGKARTIVGLFGCILSDCGAHVAHAFAHLMWAIFHGVAFPCYLPAYLGTIQFEANKRRQRNEESCEVGTKKDKAGATKSSSAEEEISLRAGMRLVVIATHCGLHAWLSALSIALLANLCFDVEEDWFVRFAAPSTKSIFTLLVYLCLSEMFEHGFCYHPYYGYFLNVHSSKRRHTAPTTDTETGLALSVTGGCQPTTSTYGILTTIATGCLNYHVEHHDFPAVPWMSLPKVRTIAKAHYAGLRTGGKWGLVGVVASYVLCADRTAGYAEGYACR